MSKSKLFPTAQMKSDGGIWLTRALFLETSVSNPHNILFTLKEENHEGYQSFPNIYFALTENDPTEYEFAMTVFGSWEHWNVVADSSMLKPVMVKLREEKNVRQKAKAVKFMLDEVSTKGKSSFAAAKLLLGKPWEDRLTPVTPADAKKAVVARRKAKVAEDDKVYSDKALNEDAKRLGLIN